MKNVRKAFTLIELLIVVAIIGILAAIAVPNFLNAQGRAKISRTVADMKALHTAMETYNLDNNAYPPDYDSGRVPGVSIQNNEILTYVRLTTPVSYMSSIPRDPYFIGPNGKQDHVKLDPLFQYAGPPGSMDRPAWRASNTMYTMTSLGPDKQDQRAWSRAQNNVHDILFNLTNGMNSLGDLYMSNGGVLVAY